MSAKSRQGVLTSPRRRATSRQGRCTAPGTPRTGAAPPPPAPQLGGSAGFQASPCFEHHLFNNPQTTLRLPCTQNHEECGPTDLLELVDGRAIDLAIEVHESRLETGRGAGKSLDFFLLCPCCASYTLTRCHGTHIASGDPCRPPAECACLVRMQSCSQLASLARQPGCLCSV